MTDATCAPTDSLRARNKLEKLRRIKEAAQSLFIAKGFDDTTMREIAVRAGVGLGTIFLYAKDKRDLLFLTINEPLQHLTQQAEGAVDPEAPLIDNLLAIAKLHYRFFGEQPALARLALREMIFYDSGAQAASFQKTRERLIRLFGHTIELAIRHGVRTVIGTTGFDPSDIEELDKICHEKGIGGIIAPNFSIGAILKMKFAAHAAKYFPDLEIIEYHGEQKLDAPSGTAIKTADLISEVRKEHRQGNPAEHETIEDVVVPTTS